MSHAVKLRKSLLSTIRGTFQQCVTVMGIPQCMFSTHHSQATFKVNSVRLNVEKDLKKTNKKKNPLLRSIISLLISPSHIELIPIQRPLKAITGPVVTPSYHLSLRSLCELLLAWQLFPVPVPMFSKNSWEELILNWWPNMADNQGRKPNYSLRQSSKQNTPTVPDDNAEWLELETVGQTKGSVVY